MIEEIKETFANAILALKGQKLRSALTLLGIIIGIIAIVTLLSVGNGVNQSITKQFEEMGSNSLMVMPGKGGFSSMVSKLEKKDPDKIEQIPGVDFVVGIYLKSKPVTFNKKTKTILIIGVNPKDQDRLKKIGMITIKEGRQLNNSDNYTVLLGKKVNEVFDEELKLKQKIKIGEHEFRIVGLLDSAGSFFGAMYDASAIIPKKTLETIVPNITPSRIMVKTIDNKQNNEVKEKIIQELKKAHGKEDFRVMTSDKIIETAQSTLGLIQLVLLAIAAISLIVGGIGIMNTMLMSVTERTKEIGLMKALGATNQQVLTQFITEAAIIGLIGGTIGTIIGLLISFSISFIAAKNNFDLPIGIDLITIFGGIFFAIIVGVLSGAYPAIKASKLDPVEALQK